MEKNIFTCPRCGKVAREYNKMNYHIFDETYYELMKHDFKDKADIDNYYIAECLCDDCFHHFRAKVFLNVETIKIENIES